MRKIVIFLVISVSIFFLLRALFALPPTYNRHNVTAFNIRKIKIGMTQSDVTRILGTPADIINDRPQYCGSNCISMWYPGPIRFNKVCPDGGIVWVHFKANHVISVYAKRNIRCGMDDEGIYSLDKDGTAENPNFANTF